MTIEQLDDIAERFVGWQCRLRQYAVRRGDGRPSPGMCPAVTLPDGDHLGAVVTVLVKNDPAIAAAEFRHVVRQTQDPLARYEAAIRKLQTTYYQTPRDFSDRLTALFNDGSSIASRLEAARRCTLAYRQANQAFSMECAVEKLAETDASFQATYWHNAMFNPRLSGPVVILRFAPDWSSAVAEIA